MGRQTTLCHICGAILASPADREAHRQAAHPGVKTEWRNRRLWIMEPDGTERAVTLSQLRAMRAEARARRDAELAPPIEPATTGEAVRIEPGPVPEPPPSATPPASPSRTAIATALTQETLADILRHASEAISDLDGAGPAGALSRVEAAQISYLIYDATLDVVERWFGGDVNRFKLALAVGIIVLAKGRVHAQAISRKLAERKAKTEAERVQVPDEARDDWAPERSNGTGPDPEEVWYAELARRQAEWAQEGSNV